MSGITIPHLVDFGPDGDAVGRRLSGPEAWDRLRVRPGTPFSLPATRAEWEAAANREAHLEARMRAVADALGAVGATTVASYGAGTGIPDLWLHRVAPELELTLTEAAPGTAAQLRALFTEADVVLHDLTRDPPLPADAHVFHRIDTEFPDRRWRRIFHGFASQAVVVVATDVLSWERARRELRYMRRHRREGWRHAGWIRTAGAFERLWRRSHRGEHVRFGDLEGWVLRPRRH